MNLLHFHFLPLVHYFTDTHRLHLLHHALTLLWSCAHLTSHKRPDPEKFQWRCISGVYRSRDWLTERRQTWSQWVWLSLEGCLDLPTLPSPFFCPRLEAANLISFEYTLVDIHRSRAGQKTKNSDFFITNSIFDFNQFFSLCFNIFNKHFQMMKSI